MKLICVRDFEYGNPVPPTYRAIDGATVVKGTATTKYEAGKEYEVPDALGVRLLRDFGPFLPGNKENPDQAFEAVNPSEALQTARRLRTKTIERINKRDEVEVA